MTSSLDMIRGRQVVQTLTNQSGGSVIAGDVVIVSAANDESFTTTTSAAYNSTRVGVAQESIAAAATGRILLEGYAPLVNVSASATRGHYLLTHTVAKQATSQASYAAGAFGQIIKAGTTPSAMIFPVAQVGSAGSVATDAIWDAAGDLAVGTGADTAAKLTIGAAGTVPTAGASTLAYAFPPGYEFNYAQITGNVSVTATVEASADTVVSSGAVAYDGSTIVMIEFYCDMVNNPTGYMLFWLFDGSSSIGLLAQMYLSGSIQWQLPLYVRKRLTPSNASHTYSIRATVQGGTGTVYAGAGGAGTHSPAFIRIVKV